MHRNEPEIDDIQEMTDAALTAARWLALGIGNSEVFRRFEEAQAAFQADETAKTMLRAYQGRHQDLRAAAMWAGIESDQERALEQEWQEVSRLPAIRNYLQAMQSLRELFRDVTGRITQEIGVDYGAVNSRAGGCC